MVLAQEVGLDLVEISPNANPPVAKIMDFGKFKYEQQKKESEARKKQKTIEVKEIKFRPNTDTHDYDVKMRSVFKFLEGGDKVKITLRFRGREMAHMDLGRRLLERVADDVVELGKIEGHAPCRRPPDGHDDQSDQALIVARSGSDPGLCRDCGPEKDVQFRPSPRPNSICSSERFENSDH